MFQYNGRHKADTGSTRSARWRILCVVRPARVEASKAVPFSVILVFLSACSAAFAQLPMGGVSRQLPPEKSVSRIVRFPTSDGVTIEASYYPAKASGHTKTPVAILIHMYPSDRSSWQSFANKLRKEGITALAYDIRGRGGSIEPTDRHLKEGYVQRRPEHFRAAWKDAEGAKKWLSEQENVDASKLVLIGASIGCSISLDYASRHPDVKAVVCLSPGTHYMGVDSIAHIKKCSTVPILLMSPKAEFGAVKKLVEASGGRAKSKQYPGGHENHGTGMFHASYGKKVKKKILSFVKKHLDLTSKKKKKRRPHA